MPGETGFSAIAAGALSAAQTPRSLGGADHSFAAAPVAQLGV